MAAEFLKSHGIDLQYEISRVQFGENPKGNNWTRNSEDTILGTSKIENARLYGRDPNTLWDVSMRAKKINCICSHSHDAGKKDCVQHDVLDAKGAVLAPSLCHPHIHLDKCFLFYDDKYSDLEIMRGDFEEALNLTATAKSRFEMDDLLRRGRWLISESIAAGVTHMRAFVEVDNIVNFKCLDASLKLKEEYKEHCNVQICVFGQEPICSSGKNYPEGAILIEEALKREDVDVLGTTPDAEQSEIRARSNIEWAVKTALKFKKHLDLHLDYSLDGQKASLVPYVIETAKKMDWANDKTIVIGYCSRQTLLNSIEWQSIQKQIGDLPIFFLGLPASDILMMGETNEEKYGERVRNTIQIPETISGYNPNGIIRFNNVGNAFTHRGNPDPMSIVSLGVGLYQANTIRDTEVLYERVSNGAKAAIGFRSMIPPFHEGSDADFVLFGRKDAEKVTNFRSVRKPKTIQQIVFDPPQERTTIFQGRFSQP